MYSNPVDEYLSRLALVRECSKPGNQHLVALLPLIYEFFLNPTDETLYNRIEVCVVEANLMMQKMFLQMKQRGLDRALFEPLRQGLTKRTQEMTELAEEMDEIRRTQEQNAEEEIALLRTIKNLPSTVKTKKKIAKTETDILKLEEDIASMTKKISLIELRVAAFKWSLDDAGDSCTNLITQISAKPENEKAEQKRILGKRKQKDAKDSSKSRKRRKPEKKQREDPQ
ncbi:hypothetical protein L596_018018 [Steinernema carpocapsae]|uniref:Uncharacterized protein n=1 Tax=Steinernema carpocapsae TaxID=34508 RepID=A0A4U5N3N0_STECR|nr:hypothetical protein L596_018018 [Steinernema carpocapsae]